jgi:hypothetical protein
MTTPNSKPEGLFNLNFVSKHLAGYYIDVNGHKTCVARAVKWN